MRRGRGTLRQWVCFIVHPGQKLALPQGSLSSPESSGDEAGITHGSALLAQETRLTSPFSWASRFLCKKSSICRSACSESEKNLRQRAPPLGTQADCSLQKHLEFEWLAGSRLPSPTTPLLPWQAAVIASLTNQISQAWPV